MKDQILKLLKNMHVIQKPSNNKVVFYMEAQRKGIFSISISNLAQVNVYKENRGKIRHIWHCVFLMIRYELDTQMNGF